MSILITYTSALEVMRLPEFPELAAQWSERTGYIPEKLPAVEELERILDSCPPLRGLSRPLHLLVSSDNNSHTSKRVVRHVTRLVHPRTAFVRIAEEVCVTSPELLPLQMARVTTSLEETLLMCELCGTYAISAGYGDGMLQRRETLTTRKGLEAFLDSMGSCYGRSKVREALPLVCADSGSPYESKLGVRLRAQREQGGYKLSFVSMNEELSLEAIGAEFERKQVRKPDILVLAPAHFGPEARMPFRGIAVDYKGRIHDDPVVAERDDTRRNELLAHGIKPYEIRKKHYDDIDYMDSFVTKIQHDLRLPADDLAFGREARIALHDAMEKIDGVHWGRADLPNL